MLPHVQVYIKKLCHFGVNPATGLTVAHYLMCSVQKKIAHYLMCSVHGCKEGFAWMNPTCQNYAHHAGWL